ncbi:MAG: hypothetical protein ACK5MW_02855 [Enterococcus sp.]
MKKQTRQEIQEEKQERRTQMLQQARLREQTRTVAPPKPKKNARKLATNVPALPTAAASTPLAQRLQQEVAQLKKKNKLLEKNMRLQKRQVKQDVQLAHQKSQQLARQLQDSQQQQRAALEKFAALTYELHALGFDETNFKEEFQTLQAEMQAFHKEKTTIQTYKTRLSAANSQLALEKEATKQANIVSARLKNEVARAKWNENLADLSTDEKVAELLTKVLTLEQANTQLLVEKAANRTWRQMKHRSKENQAAAWQAKAIKAEETSARLKKKVAQLEQELTQKEQPQVGVKEVIHETVREIRVYPPKVLRPPLAGHHFRYRHALDTVRAKGYQTPLSIREQSTIIKENQELQKINQDFARRFFKQADDQIQRTTPSKYFGERILRKQLQQTSTKKVTPIRNTSPRKEHVALSQAAKAFYHDKQLALVHGNHGQRFADALKPYFKKALLINPFEMNEKTIFQTIDTADFTLLMTDATSHSIFYYVTNPKREDLLAKSFVFYKPRTDAIFARLNAHYWSDIHTTQAK